MKKFQNGINKNELIQTNIATLSGQGSLLSTGWTKRALSKEFYQASCGIGAKLKDKDKKGQWVKYKGAWRLQYEKGPTPDEFVKSIIDGYKDGDDESLGLVNLIEAFKLLEPIWEYLPDWSKYGLKLHMKALIKIATRLKLL